MISIYFWPGMSRDSNLDVSLVTQLISSVCLSEVLNLRNAGLAILHMTFHFQMMPHYNHVSQVLEASRLTSVFWLGFGLGRGIGVLASRKIQPKTIIAWSILGSIIDMVMI